MKEMESRGIPYIVEQVLKIREPDREIVRVGAADPEYKTPVDLVRVRDKGAVDQAGRNDDDISRAKGAELSV